MVDPGDLGEKQYVRYCAGLEVCWYSLCHMPGLQWEDEHVRIFKYPKESKIRLNDLGGDDTDCNDASVPRA